MTYQVKGPVNVAPGIVLKRVAALALLASSGGLLVPACADNESSLFIRGRKPPDEACLVECSPGGTFDAEGEIDAAFETSFAATLVVGNQIVTRGDSDVLRTETSRVQLYEAEVRIVALDGTATAAYAVPLSGTVDPGTSNDAGYGCASVPLLDGNTLQALRDRAAEQGGVIDVISNVIVRGRTLGGQEVETAEWAYPISICVGCTCVDTAPATCCASTGSVACADLDAVERPCSGTLSAHDCRLVAQSCGDYLQSFGL